MSLKLRRSFGSNDDGKERGLALCGLVPGYCDNGLKERQLRRGEREKKQFQFMFYETMGGLNSETVGGCEIF